MHCSFQAPRSVRESLPVRAARPQLGCHENDSWTATAADVRLTARSDAGSTTTGGLGCFPPRRGAGSGGRAKALPILLASSAHPSPSPSSTPSSKPSLGPSMTTSPSSSPSAQPSSAPATSAPSFSQMLALLALLLTCRFLSVFLSYFIFEF